MHCSNTTPCIETIASTDYTTRQGGLWECLLEFEITINWLKMEITTAVNSCWNNASVNLWNRFWFFCFFNCMCFLKAFYHSTISWHHLLLYCLQLNYPLSRYEVSDVKLHVYRDIDTLCSRSRDGLNYLSRLSEWVRTVKVLYRTLTPRFKR